LNRKKVWYSNVYFREKILKLKFDKFKILESQNEIDDDFNPSEEKLNSLLNDTNNIDTITNMLPKLKIKTTDCIGANLQMIFTLMKNTLRRSIDIKFFINTLGLDSDMQQVTD
jgi:hypothetical protein